MGSKVKKDSGSRTGATTSPVQGNQGFLGPWIWYVVVVALFFVPLFTNQYHQFIINMALVNILLTLGLNVVFGYSGQFAFANAAFFGIGAYTSALLTVDLGIPFWFSMPLGGFAAMIIGVTISIPALRLARFYLAIMTLALQEAIQWVFIHWESVTYGVTGVNVPYPTLGSFICNTDNSIYYINLVTALLILWMVKNILSSHIGRAFVAIRDSEIAAQCMAIPLVKYKILAYAISAFISGIAGGLYCITVGFLTPDNFGFVQVTLHFAMVIVGGLGSLVGSVVGALVLTSLPEFLRDYHAYQELFYGLIVVMILLFMREGIAGWLKRFELLKDRLTH
jgi:branched-chain amino acid transport system permease protein